MKFFVGASLAVLALNVDATSVLTNSFNKDAMIHKVESAYEAVYDMYQGMHHLPVAVEDESKSYLQHVENLSKGAFESMREEFQTVIGELHGGDECGRCVCKGSCHIMGEVKKGWEKLCRTAKAPKLQHICQKSAAHPRFALGYTLGMVRPMEKSYFYCFGHGECPHPNVYVPNDGLMMSDARAVVNQDDLDVMVANVIGNLVEKVFEVEGLNAVEIEDFEELEKNTLCSATNCGCKCTKGEKCGCKPGCKCPCCQNRREEEEKLLAFSNFGMDDIDNDATSCEEENGRNCHMKKCTKRVGIKAFRWSLRKIHNFCEHTKCPVLRKYCAMGKKHPEIAAGLIWYKLRPMEWSSGFCHGKMMAGRRQHQHPATA